MGSSSPYINHFTQPDSLIPDPSNPQAWNRYSYVGNRPINFNDPTGHNEECGLGELGCSTGKYTSPSDQSGSLDRVIASYGITTTGFDRNEKWAILRAARIVGGKFAEERGNDESAVEAFSAVYAGGINIKQEGDAGICGDVVASAGGCTDGAHQIRFWTMTGHQQNDIDRMTKNVVHEFGHAYDWTHYNPADLTRASNHMSADLTRDTVLRPNMADGEVSPHHWDWQQSPYDTSNEIFGDMFIAWTYNAWNTDPANSPKVTAAQSWMNGLVP